MPAQRTKIVCTLGPATDSEETIRTLLEAGMDGVRLNFSHGTHESHARLIRWVRRIAEEANTYIAILQDLSGPKMRIGTLAVDPLPLTPGNPLTLTIRPDPTDPTQIPIDTPLLASSVRPGDRLLLADGEIALSVLTVTDGDIRCEVLVGGELRSNKGIHAPGVPLKESVPTAKDIEDLRFGIEQGVDWIAQSFVRSAQELRRLRAILQHQHADIPIMAKIEKQEALDDLGAILAAADGVMIARGDLGLEIPLAEVPLAQKRILTQANRAGRPALTATQMLESMILHARPTRAEVTDVANAILDGTDALMLSGETAIGAHPVEATRMMAQIAHATEASIDYIQELRSQPLVTGDNIPDAIAHAACHTALQLDAALILCCTRSGQTARLVSKYRPHAPIAVASPYEETLRQCALLWGTWPIRVEMAEDTDTMIANAKRALVQSGLARPGDRIVIVAGIPVDVPGTTNMIKAEVVE